MLNLAYWRHLPSRIRNYLLRPVARVVLCSNCFRDAGIARTSMEVGYPLRKACPHCGSTSGCGLTCDELFDLVFRFFVRGSYYHGLGGYAPVLISGSGPQDQDIVLREDTKHDWDLIRSVSNQSLGYHGPPLWRLGYTEHWDVDDIGQEIEWTVTEKGAERAISEAPIRELSLGSELYRIRLNLNEEEEINDYEFDTPPTGVQRALGRFDSEDVPVFYAGRNIDVCLHEMRLSNRDAVTVATCRILRNLRLLDITGDDCKRGETPFEDPHYFFAGLVFSNDRLKECRFLARKMRDAGFDGFLYQSYHAPLMYSPGVNVALFGWPIRDGKVSVRSMNNVFISRIKAEYELGPLVR